MIGGQTFIFWDISYFRIWSKHFLERCETDLVYHPSLIFQDLVLLFNISLYSLLIPALTFMFLCFNWVGLIRKVMNRCPWLWLNFDGLSLIFQQREGVPPSEQSITSLKKHKKGGLQMWELGFWLHWQLWGTEVSQSRKWLDLPCGRLAHPDNNPHSSECPGTPQAPTEGHRATAEKICWSRWQKF